MRMQVFIMPELVGLVMEFIPGGDLFQYLRNHGRLSEDQARWVFQQVLLMPYKPCNPCMSSGVCTLAFPGLDLFAAHIHLSAEFPTSGDPVTVQDVSQDVVGSAEFATRKVAGFEDRL